MVEPSVTFLHHSFLVRLLRQRIRVLNQQAAFEQTTNMEYLDGLLQYIRSHREELPIEAEVYYQLYDAFIIPGQPQVFEATRQLLHTQVKRFSRFEAEELYTCLINLGLRRLNQGDLAYLSPLLEVYKEALDFGLLLEKGKLLAHHARNISNLALRQKEFAWVETFIESWKGRMIADYADNTYRYVVAMLAYYQGDYTKAEHNFNRILQDFKNPYFGLNSRGYLLQVFYETGNAVGLESMSHSFRMYLDRNKGIPRKRIYQYITFINHLKRLCNIPIHESGKLEELKRQILEKEEKGMGSDWLVEKIDELLK